MSVTTVSVEKPTRPGGNPKSKPKPPWRCQFCVTGNHRSCPRATEHNGVMWFCKCDQGEHAGLHCITCKHDHPDEVSPERWRCFDRHGCAARHQARKDTNPIWRMVHASRVHSAIVEKQKRQMRERAIMRVDPELDAGIERLQGMLDQLMTAKRKRNQPNKPKPPKRTSGKCECCGEPTRGGQFLPGHDAKHASALVGRIRDSGDLEAYEELKRRGWLKKLPAALQTKMEAAA